MTYCTRPVAALALIGLASGCGAIRQAHDQRLVTWERAGITVDQARDILGTPPYAIPDLEIVAIHLDGPSQVVMVYQRVQPGVLISLSQHRGRYLAPTSRAFWARERLSVERVSFAAGPPAPDRYYVYVQNGAGASPEAQLVQRRLTRVVDNVTLRIWGDAVTEQDLIRFLGAARPFAATQSAPPPR